ACKRLPCLESAGIHTVINGPITYTPDGVPLVGRLPGRQNAWCITGLRAGLGEGGGHGWLLAQMIAHGEACYDTWALDPRRFGSWANQDYTALKAIEDYQNEFRFHRPHEHRPAGRPARTTPLTPVLEAAGAAFGVVNGWERALFFKPSPDFTDQHEFGFTPTKDVVAAEVACVRDRVGIMEVNGFNRIEIAGEGAAEWLARLIAGRIPTRVGKVGLCYALTDQGNVAIEATLARLGEDRFWWGSAAAAEDHDWDWLEAQRPEGVTLTRLTESHTILVLAGPGSRALLTELAPRGGWDDFPWLSLREVRIGQWPVMAMSVSFSGELAWELHIPNHALLGVYHMLVAAGEAHGLGHFGLYATESMRIEKGYRHWKADLITEFDPYESGLDRFVKLDHMFPGRSALEGRYGNDPSQLIQQEPRELPDQAETPSGERALAGASEAGVSSMHSGAASGTCSIGVLPGSAVAVGPQRGKRRAFVTLEVFTDTAPAHPGDSLYRDGRVVGTVTSAAWGHRVGKNLAMGFVEPDLSAETTEFSIELLGQTYPARVVAPCLYDPKNERLRA
ncbi:MAG: glycine cleavage T C-terminal barrel domain-containing protein, partial [Pseudomonadota bacterium]